MPYRKRIPQRIIAELDTLELSAIAEYLAYRHDVARKLTFLFRPDGRYDRVLVDGKRPHRGGRTS